MKKTWLLVLVLPLILAGCGKKNTTAPSSNSDQTSPAPIISDSLNMENKPTIEYLKDEKFILSPNEQEAIFYVKTGLTGGAGSTAVIDATTGALKQVDGKALYIPSEISKLVDQGLSQYKCMQGSPYIRIAAKIQLKEETYENESIPGGSKQSYYEVQILELQSLDIKATPC